MADDDQRSAQPDDLAHTQDRIDRDTARAGHAALLDTLADLLLRELDPLLARQIATDPALGPLLVPPVSDDGIRHLRGDYARLLLIEIPPYGSVYLDNPPTIGGRSTLQWERLLGRLGYTPAALERAAASDHAGLALRALARAERDMERADEAGLVFAAIVRWLPQCCTALADSAGDTFYGHVAELMALTIQEYTPPASPAVLAGLSTYPWEEDATPSAFMPSPNDDLRTLTRWLCTPVQSGWYLSKERIRHLARAFGVGTAIVERERMLEQVFEASGLDRRTVDLIDSLLVDWERWSRAQRGWGSALGTWASHLDDWRAALDRCHTALSVARAAIAES